MPKNNSWFLKEILLPYFVTRILLVVSGLLAPFFIKFNTAEQFSESNLGLLFSSQRLIDMWARWDSGWYLSIVNFGYSMGADVNTPSNLPFFPLFPAVVKLLGFLVPSSFRSDATYVVIGVLVSNILLVGSLVILYKITQRLFPTKKIAPLVVWSVLVFPSSFFLSAFYSESIYLFLILLSYWYALQRKWLHACIAAAFLTASRMLGAFIVVPLFFEYLASLRYDLRKINYQILWFGLIPVGLLSFFGYLYNLTGDFLISIKSHAAWGRNSADPITSFLFPSGFWAYVTPLDQFWVISGLVLSIQMILEKIGRLKILGIYTVLLFIPPLLTGTLDSFSRFVVVMFPLFIYWSYLTHRNKRLFWSVSVVFLIIQIIYFGLFSQFYWVG